MAKLRVKELAEQQNMNRSQLQIKSGVTMNLLRRYWDNSTESVLLEALDKIAGALGVMVPDLFVPEVVPQAVKLERNREIEATIKTLLDQLPEGYPADRTLEFKDGYQLHIGGYSIYRSKDADDALNRTKRYVDARDGHPGLPVGVIDGIYD